MMVIFILFLLITCTTSNTNHVKIYGPGLQPHIFILPARYFFIQSQNASNLLDFEPDVKIFGDTKAQRPCRIWTQILNRKDAFYIVRYKLYEKCENLEIHVKYNNEHIGESPYKIDKAIYCEDCDCPQNNIDLWLSNWQCNYPNQLRQDLSLFKSINWDLIRNKLIKEYDNPGGISLCHYIIKSNKIFRTCYGKHVGFKMFMDNILLSISRKIHLPDLEFFVNLGDWPLVSNSAKYPIFSWCGSSETFDIVMPTYDISESSLENMGSVTMDMLSVQGNLKEKWEKRIPKVFWRGRDSNLERLKLVNISREHPDLFNVSLTNFFFYRDEIHIYGPKADHVSFFEFFNYKYQIALDGTVAAYRFPYLLAGGSLIFKQNSKYYEHFYNELKPNTHYISIRRDLSDLMEKLEWAMKNSQESQKIAEAGQKFAIENLLPVNIYCYYIQLLNEFSKKITSEIKVLPNMEEVKYLKKTTECKCSDNIKDEL